jgi:hypothetical protein
LRRHGQLTGEQADTVAPRARIGHLVLTHTGPRPEQNEENPRRARERFAGEVEQASEGAVYTARPSTPDDEASAKLAPMTAPIEPPPYYALRVCPLADAPQWWTSARQAAARAPLAIQAILAGRTRVEVSAEEATDALAFARTLDGWDPERLTPVWIYPATPREA